MWIILVLLYGICKGTREIFKKKALEKNTVIDVLTISSVLAVVFVLPQYKDAMGLDMIQYLWIAIKSFIIFVAWIVGFKAIKHLPISMYGVLDLSRVIFATILGFTVLKEQPTVTKTLGLLFVCAGLLLLKYTKKENKEEKNIADKSQGFKISRGSTAWYVLLAFISCALNAVSGLLDKILMSDMNSSQLQFWYVIFLAVYYLLYVIITRTKISKTVWKNIWVWLLAIMLIAMDKLLFIANGIPDSQVTVMTLIKQIGVIVTIIAGKFVFKEKNILHKLVCAGIIILGIILGII